MTAHHILIDGWSAPQLQRELLTLYADRGDDSGLPPVTPYRDYLGWLSRQDPEATKDAWRQALEGLPGPSLVADPGQDRPAVLPGLLAADLPEQLTGELLSGVRGFGVTVNTLLQGVWALVLAELTGRSDVVFGSWSPDARRSCPGRDDGRDVHQHRPGPGQAGAGDTLGANLARLQHEQALLLGHQYARLGDLQRLVGRGTCSTRWSPSRTTPAERRRPSSTPGCGSRACPAGTRRTTRCG
ncbi:hypothetical protein GXW82_09405 [Streptacidiphilus sp. 4-A2]|nr:hypothetical protein [Streptacidiphilus sp. 4-A2]